MQIAMNIGIGVVAIVGFFWFYGKSNGWFKEGGLVNEWFKGKAGKKNKEDNNDNEDE